MLKQLIIFFLLFFTIGAYAQDIPDRPEPARLVNDFAGVLNSGEKQQLEGELEQFSRSTSNQIVIVTVPSTEGYSISSYAFQLGEKWGVGQKNKDNGVVVVFQPKTASQRGQVFIAVGYGLEGVIPDAIAHRTIVENEMIPHFKKGDIYGGLKAGTEVIMGLAKGEFSASDYQKKVSHGSAGGFGGAILFFIIVIFILARVLGGRRRYYTGGSSLPFWLLMGSSFLGSESRRGNWDDFSGGGGSFGGGGFGGGDFGGFGGGSFGGGGAGGSW